VQSESVIEKACSKCQEIKPLSEFHRSASSRDGRTSRCRTCRSENARTYAARRRAAERAAEDRGARLLEAGVQLPALAEEFEG
jgi:hypothetical protein